MAHQLAKYVKKCQKTTHRHRVQPQFELREVSSTLKSTIFNRVQPQFELRSVLNTKINNLQQRHKFRGSSKIEEQHTPLQP
jgi:hypothetical protein